MRLLAIAVSVVLLGGCELLLGSGSGAADAGVRDSDASSPAGSDAGEYAGEDAATPFDAGDVDAGSRVEICDGMDNDGDGLVDEGHNGGLLMCNDACPLSLFGGQTYIEEFDSSAEFWGQWWTNTSFPTPAVSAGALRFPASVATASWDRRYNEIGSYDSSLGDVLICATFTETPTADRDDHFDMAMRGGLTGMTLKLLGKEQQIFLQSTDSNGNWTWPPHAQASFPVQYGATHHFALVLWGEGDNFVGEIKDVDADVDVLIKATISKPPAGRLGIAAWDLANELSVERLVVGPASASATAILRSQFP